ncbi:MAG: IclR family transcriptional regulator [Quadrisphaera sp.]
MLGRAVRIVEAFRPGEDTLAVTELARRSGLHLATTSRMVGQLVDLGLLRREPDRRVGLGMRLWELGSRASPALTLREAAMPVMEDLHAVVGHHTQLGVLDGREVLFLERLSAPDAVINYTRIAGRLPLHASSSGLVLLAHAPRELQEEVLAGPLRIFTQATIATPRALRAALDRVRREGAAVCPGHFHPDACGVAVPVRSASGAVVAALSVIVPNDADARTHVTALRAAARGASRRLTSH